MPPDLRRSWVLQRRKEAERRSLRLQRDSREELGLEKRRQHAPELNKCLDVTGATASGTALQLWDCNGTGAQECRWRQQTQLVNPRSGCCLNLVGEGIVHGTRPQISNCGDTAGQVWELQRRRDPILAGSDCSQEKTK
jgi:Ricin-type beta-trefoil lectin domain